MGSGGALVIRHLDRASLREDFNGPNPFRYVLVDDLLERDFALRVAASLPDLEHARELGFGFDFVNERNKVQICDAAQFPPAVLDLHAQLASPEFLALLCDVTGIPGLLADPDRKS